MEPSEAKIVIEALKDDPQQAVIEIDKWTCALEATNKNPGDGEPLCEYGRLLAFATILASSPGHEGLWVESRIRRVLAALIGAVDASANTRFHRNCVPRPRHFMDGLAVAYLGKKQMEQCLERIRREHADVIQRGMPILSAVA